MKSLGHKTKPLVLGIPWYPVDSLGILEAFIMYVNLLIAMR